MKKMDYTIGFQGGRPGPTWTATALTDREKVRTPEPITFEDRPAALKFLKDLQDEGYRFAGASSIDPEQRMVKNRYFVIGANGELIFSGEDNGLRDTVWEVGDVMPGRNRNTGTEGVMVVRRGCDVTNPGIERKAILWNNLQ
jgi:hypothetical protein